MLTPTKREYRRPASCRDRIRGSSHRVSPTSAQLPTPVPALRPRRHASWCLHTALGRVPPRPACLGSRPPTRGQMCARLWTGVKGFLGVAGGLQPSRRDSRRPARLEHQPRAECRPRRARPEAPGPPTPLRNEHGPPPARTGAARCAPTAWPTWPRCKKAGPGLHATPPPPPPADTAGGRGCPAGKVFPSTSEAPSPGSVTRHNWLSDFS